MQSKGQPHDPQFFGYEEENTKASAERLTAARVLPGEGPGADRHEADDMSMSFSGNVVLVAGGTGGLGRAVSLAFLKEGANVVATYRSQEEFAALESAAGAAASLLDGRRVDVTDEAAVSQLVDRILAEHGRLDVMVNTVGGYAGGVKLWELDTKVFDRMLALNLRAGYALSRAAMAPMLSQKHGVIVNVAAKAAFDHAAGAAAYAASKAAALAMIDSLAADAKGTGVRVNSILPSIIDTEANRKAMPNADYAAWPKPEEIARVILFLSSDDAKVIHGAAIPVYGNS
jgi:NAD(P)-dependent dehydrogenase (short-subunit alcohol dehydrogenase family)